MHELGITQGIIDRAREAAVANGARKVAGLYLVMTPAADFTQDSIEMYFEMLTSEDEFFKGARLHVEHKPVAATCLSCSDEFTRRAAADLPAVRVADGPVGPGRADGAAHGRRRRRRGGRTRVTLGPVSGRSWAQARWLHLLVLAVPFVVVIAGWRGLTQPFPAFQGADEVIHYEIVRRAADQWPRPLLGGYGAWSGPLVYWLLATLATPFGASPSSPFGWSSPPSRGARARSPTRLVPRPPRRPAARRPLRWRCSSPSRPSSSGSRSIVLTDNPAWFFVGPGPRAMSRLRPAADPLADRRRRRVRGARRRPCGTWLVWLLLPAIVAVFSVPQPRRRQAAALGMLVVAAVPLLCTDGVLGRSAASRDRSGVQVETPLRPWLSAPQPLADPRRRRRLRRSAPAGGGAAHLVGARVRRDRAWVLELAIPGSSRWRLSPSARWARSRAS